MESRAIRTADTSVPLGIGYYTVPEAVRLLRVPARSLDRWLGGYAYGPKDAPRDQPPLWVPELPRAGSRIELGFRDLIALRFVAAFVAAFRAPRLVGIFLARAVHKAPVVKKRERIPGVWPALEALSETVEGGALFERPISGSRLRQLKL